MGSATKAGDLHRYALELAEDYGDPDQQARAHAGIGDAAALAGDAPVARQHWERSLTLFTELGAPEADIVRARLASLDDSGQEPDAPQ